MNCKHTRIRVLQVEEQRIIDPEKEVVVGCAKCKTPLSEIERIGHA